MTRTWNGIEIVEDEAMPEGALALVCPGRVTVFGGAGQAATWTVEELWMWAWLPARIGRAHLEAAEEKR